MARPIKNTVDYFPHIIQNGKTIFILESKYGNDGYAFWFKLLELLGSSHNQVYDYNNPADWEFLLAKTKVSEEMANSILKTLADLEAIDKELLKKKLIWCENFIKGIEDVYKRRKVDIPKKPVNDNIKPVSVDINPVNDNKNRQSKVKYIKVNKSNKEKDIKESKDSFSDKSKTKDNEPLEFSFEDKCWWGLYDWRIKMYQGAFPMLTVNYLFNDKWKTKFLSDPAKYKKMIKEKYEGDITKLVWAWLQQAKKFYIKDHPNLDIIKKGSKLK